MKLDFDVNIEGLRAGQKRIQKVTKKVLFDCMLKMRELAVTKVPVDSGLLKRSIKLRPYIEGAKRYMLRADTEYAEAVEYGTSPHVIKPKTKKALAFKFEGDKEKSVFKQVKHPGTQAQPYFRPALHEVKNYWVKQFWKQELNK